MRLETFATKHNFEICDGSDDLQEGSEFDAKLWLDHVNNDCEPAAALYRKGEHYTIRNIWGMKAHHDQTVSEAELKLIIKACRDIA